MEIPCVQQAFNKQESVDETRKKNKLSSLDEQKFSKTDERRNVKFRSILIGIGLFSS